MPGLGLRGEALGHWAASSPGAAGQLWGGLWREGLVDWGNWKVTKPEGSKHTPSWGPRRAQADPSLEETTHLGFSRALWLLGFTFPGIWTSEGSRGPGRWECRRGPSRGEG